MIPFEEAYSKVMESAVLMGTERIPLDNALHRILAEDVISDVDMPPFNKAAVDGYACRSQDLHLDLEVIELIPAGVEPVKKIGKGECSKIMTGARVPDGADTVIMVEHTQMLEDNKIRFAKGKSGSNICSLGEDVKKNSIVITKGSLIRPQEIAIMASTGNTHPNVFKPVDVAVISTGDELVEPDQKPGPSQIRNSNAMQLLSQIESIGCKSIYSGIAKDNKNAIEEKITVSLSGSDVVILSGGVSMGDYDYVPQVFNELGIEIIFKSVAIQPGRPTVFCKKDHQRIFGLPGNPVSSFILFEILVKPFLYKMMGHDFRPRIFRMPMSKSYSRRKSVRKSLLPVMFSDDGVIPVEYHGSAHIHAYTGTDAVVIVDIGKTEIAKGEIVDVRQI